MSTIILPADCGRDSALTVLEQLRAAAAGPPAIDASAVQTIGQAMLQVLLAARRDHPSLAIANPSPALCDAAQLTGVSDALLGKTAR